RARFPLSAAGEARAPRRRMALRAPFLRGHPLPAARPAHRHRQGIGARFRPRGIRGGAPRPAPHPVAPVGSRYTKNPVGAHYGLGDWLLQRITAVVMAGYTIVALACALLYPVRTYADWRAMFSITSFRLLTMLFVVALLYHAWVGMRDILMDYLHATG